ncbi:protein KAKU4 isoform X2 [Prunus dulcis]|uniref:protein KAKU4 isoform X2 n=1 Tax=Prunus dulcis TaxID=3755 RepID=UPI0014820A3E|nr:protein KAKU4 isoform X2 [Prunus dulcis]
MATISRSRQALESRSGGKIVRPRRVAGARTPYDRPRLANPGPENPNWFSRLIYSPTRMIASGAGKIISSVFSPDSSSSSSSEDGTDDEDVDDDDISTQEDDGLNKRNGTSGKLSFFRKEPPATLGKSDNKHVIEQLLMQETFSREECDRLIKIIKSRVVGFTTAEDAENTRPNVDTPDFCGTAVTEAKKWLKERRLGSSSKSDSDHGTCTLNSLMFPQGAEDKGGSPVDVAKLYMRARPPWASPSIKHGELRSPSSTGMQLFNEETPYSIGGNSVSTLKLKRDFRATGSWNIQDEIRRVRSKATEELLRSLPSTRIDWSASTLGNRSTSGYLVDGKQEVEMGDKIHNSKNSIGANVNLSSGVTTSYGSNVSEKTQYELQKEALPLPAIISSEQNQDSDVAAIDGKGGSQNALEGVSTTGQRLKASEDMKTAPSLLKGVISVSDVNMISDTVAGDFGGQKNSNGTEQRNTDIGGTSEVGDSKLHDITCSTTGEVTGSRNAYTTNGFPSSVASLSAPDLGIEENPILNGETNPVTSSHEKVAVDLTVEEEAHEFFNNATVEVANKNENDGVPLSEASIEVPESIENYMDVTKDNDFVATGSQNSSSMADEYFSQELTQPNSKSTPVVEKQKGKRLSRYNRRGRSRGK